ncbi:TRAP transporter substrate-binding protein [Neorhizobium galegae]|uniref:TRAP transporter substrate-binding protein n=1 Tax=Neorhizobium galegae TaxID=399 RepID=UPI0006220DD5|nr:TRAP transporter substrate-binding protein [Neorhizobium galegae]KAB1124799.1 TRAP transporter substrate-binding protein [Neorhizobium galegae]MCQ1571871.1 TRAP transporter substrate-binding protein [Neorhizobium galegae]MCQ1806340.1 TRAP transporter substrate-binding protein [Neorhizobium galegae]CDZ58265.1 2,3-diketo-L-gulonate-binding periplasmic protein YiaO [Neorhizobium galegae bv. orientalis]
MFNTMMKLALGIALPVMLFAGTASAEVRAHTLKFAAANNKGHPQVTGMEKFAEIVKTKSGGKIDVKLFPGGVLGGDVQTVSALQGGVVEMLVLNAGILSSNVKAFGAVDLPFLFNSGEEADKVMDGAFGKSLSEKLPATGLVGLAYWELGFRNLTNNRRAVTKLEDIKGLKIRTLQSPIPIELFNSLGANAVPLPYTELYTALETGTVDGQENPFANIINAKFYEVQKYLTVTRHQYNPQIVLISKKFWDGLNDEEKGILQSAATEARDFQRKVSREADAKALDEIKKTGMQVTELNSAETQKIRDAVKPLIDKFSADVGADTVSLLFKELDAVRKK